MSFIGVFSDRPPERPFDAGEVLWDLLARNDSAANEER
jgi:hypothetical protein